MRCGTAVLILALASGCAMPPKEEPAPLDQTRWIYVNTIPRGGYIERNGEYIGVAPIMVSVEATQSGRPIFPNRIRATDTPTGAWTEEVLTGLHPVPERMLLDMRSAIPPPTPFKVGP